ncbi:ribonuclease HIII [[Mycoplasma] mobile]|uniref:Ribonuclease n=1 Tax=Mycoplasma mobile (strain ATCC 43663 / 163K / NCTC 11711) TaxID=267748 RepID=Q6KIG7_MYCM1|nr:ribonuclease HIII [[Mycoplasma] mobile]AAT27609.1 ribonuclease HII [Mycoplasma mobile 163K]
MNFNEYVTIGSDETGVGDYLSPIVACAVFLNPENISKINKLDIKDSKLLTDKKIKEIAKELKKLVSHSINYFSQKGYNNLNKFFNAHEIKMFLHLKSINFLEQKHQNIDYVIIDAFSDEKNIDKYIEKLVNNKKFMLQNIKSEKKIIQKAESLSLSVACASILARNYLLEKMEEQNIKYNSIFPLGTNSIVENFTLKFVEKNGFEELYNVAKIKFKTTEKLFGLKKA